MSAESRTLARESPIRPMYFEARITRISYTLGRSCDPLGNIYLRIKFIQGSSSASSSVSPVCRRVGILRKCASKDNLPSPTLCIPTGRTF